MNGCSPTRHAMFPETGYRTGNDYSTLRRIRIGFRRQHMGYIDCARGALTACPGPTFLSRSLFPPLSSRSHAGGERRSQPCGPIRCVLGEDSVAVERSAFARVLVASRSPPPRPLSVCSVMEAPWKVHGGWAWLPPAPTALDPMGPPKSWETGGCIWLVDPNTVPPDIFLAVERCGHQPAPVPWPAEDGVAAVVLDAMISMVQVRSTTCGVGLLSNGVKGHESLPDRKRS